MRRIILALLLVFLLTLPVSAFSGISESSSSSTIRSDGSCQVELIITLQLDSLTPGLVFPVPEDASHITVNGTNVIAYHSGKVRNIDLSDMITAPGTYTLVIRYWLEDVITADKNGKLTLTLELLSGFEYPIDQLNFSITLPGAVDARPAFSSMYYQASIETMMTVVRSGSTITGSLDQRLQDHEKLTMTLAVDDQMFPQPVAKQWALDTPDLVMLGIAAASCGYWLLFLRCPLPKKLRRTTPPDGITAGEIPCRLTGQGPDLTLMILSWAQMGYLLIQPDDNDRVLLHKRMDMGSERSDFEQKCFRKLFGRRYVVDGTGYAYARLCRKVRLFRPGMQEQYRRNSGNPMLMRVLAGAVGAVSGVSLAVALTIDAGWRIVLSILLAIIGFFVALLMQNISKSLHSRSRSPLILGITACILWLLLSIVGGEWNVALCLIVFECLAGLGALYGGRRTEAGQTNQWEILGLRHYLKHMTQEEIRRNMQIDPQYFYDMSPYALALGVDREFARHLKKSTLPPCPYLTTGMDGHLTAKEWNQLLRDTVHSLDAMQKRLPLDKLLGR